MVQIIRRAQRAPNGRVIDRNLLTGERIVLAPPRLVPTVVKVLTLGEQIEAENMRQQQVELRLKWHAFWRRLGLDPKKTYRMNPKTGEVIEIGRNTPHY